MPRNLALNISVGALLDKTVGATFKSVTSATEDLGRQQKELNQQLRKLNAVKRYTDQLNRLRKEAKANGEVSESLARRIRLTETRLSAASADARRMGINVDELGKAEARLTRELEKNNKALAKRESLGKAIHAVQSGTAFAGRQVLAGGLAGTTALGGLLAAITYSNRLTAEQANLAKAVGLSAKEMGIWSAIVQQAGFDAEHVNALVEELNNKFGESKGLAEQTTAVKDAMNILRLDFERIKRLKPDQQFRAIAEATQRIGGQEAMSAADILLGGEASRIIGYLNSLNIPLEQLFKRFDRLYVGSQEGIEGARSFSSAWGELSYTLGQAFKEVTGLIGTELAPQMTQWAEQVADSFKDNRESINRFSEQIGTTLKQLGTGLTSLAVNLPKIVEAMTTLSELVLKWFGPDEKERERQDRLQAHHEEQARRRQQRQETRGERLNKPYWAISRERAQQLMGGAFETSAKPDRPEAPALTLEPVVPRALSERPAKPESFGPLKPVTLTPPKSQPEAQEGSLDRKQSPPDTASLLQRLSSIRRPPDSTTVNQDNRMNVTYNITQQSGEDGQQLARRIDRHNRELQQEPKRLDGFHVNEALA